MDCNLLIITFLYKQVIVWFADGSDSYLPNKDSKTC